MRIEPEAADRRQYLSFLLRGGDYALPIIKVKEILQYEGLTPVPGTPPSIRGVLNLRGSVVPVVDLGLKFGLGETTITRWTCILVVEALVGGAMTPTGVIADSVREVMELSADDVEPPPAFGTHVAVEWLTGMGKLDRSFVLLLDIDRVLAADEKSLSAAFQAVSEAAQEPPLDARPVDAPPPAADAAPAA